MARTVARLLEDCARRRPDKPVLLAAGRRIDWSECEGRAAALARRLAADGIGPGRRVAVAVDDPPELAIAVFGVLKTGAAATPLNPRLTDGERAKILADLAPDRLVERVPAERAAFASRETGGDACAFVLYTSGSTGAPKGAELSQRATAFALDSWRGPVMDLAPGDVALSALPLAHSLGVFGAVLAPLLAGGSVAFLPRFSPEEALDAIARHRVTVFPGVATMFRRILDSPARAGADFRSLRYALSGAAPCPWDLAQAWREATGTRIVRGYGMTELFRPISYRAAEAADRAESIGRAVPGVRLRIADGAGAPLPAGRVGELWIDSPARMTAYRGRPEETARAFSGGWFRTGDLAELSGDGFVRIVGRQKDVILRGGYTVAAGEVEAALEAHPAVSEAAAIGVADAEMGEEIAAFVTLRPGAAPSAEDLIAHCRRRIAGYKCPRYVRFAAELPRGPAGKVAKAELRLQPAPASVGPPAQSNTVSS